MLRKFLPLLLIGLSGAAPALAQQTCAGGPPSWKGLNLIETKCKNWPDGSAPPAGQYYVAVQFHFSLSAPPPGKEQWIFSALKKLFTSQDSDEITLSVVPRLGNYNTIETPIYSYSADNHGQTFSTTGQFDFSTPYIRYDQKEVSFLLRARSKLKKVHDIKGLTDRIQSITAATGVGNWLISDAAKPGLDAVANITDTILDAYYDDEESATASFVFGDATTDGVFMRELVLKTVDGQQDIGTLTASLKFRRSMLAGTADSSGNISDMKADFSNISGGIIDMDLPAVGAQDNTVLAGFGNEDSKRKLLASVVYGSDPIKDQDCRQLKSVAYGNFGFDDIDTLRMTYELLALGGKHDAYSRDSRICFTPAEWRKIAQFNIVPAEDVLPDKNLIDLFATGLRRGFKDTSIYQQQLADLLEQVEDKTGEDILSNCAGMGIAKADLAPCLAGFKLNRYQIEQADQSPITLFATRRKQVLDALSAIASSSPPVVNVSADSNASGATQTTLFNHAIAASKIPDHAYRFSLFYDGELRVRRIILEKVARGPNISFDMTERLSLPCWVNVSGQKQTCANIPIDER